MAPEGEVACRLLLEVVTPATRPRQLQLHPLPTADHLGADVTHLAGREFDLWMGRGLVKSWPHTSFGQNGADRTSLESEATRGGI